MVMTSVSGHLLNYEFDPGYRKWHSCDPVELFDAPVMKMCQETMKDIKVRYSGIIIIWCLLCRSIANKLLKNFNVSN